MKRFINIFIGKIRNSDLANSGAVLAYNILFALFPFLIVLLNMTSFFLSGYESQVLDLLNVFPDQVVGIIRPVIVDIIGSSSSGIFSLSLIMAIWSSSNGVFKLMTEINKAFDFTEKPGLVKTRLISIALSFALILVIFVMLVSGPISNIIKNVIEYFIGEMLVIDLFFNLLINVLPYIFIILVLALIYKVSLFNSRVKIIEIIPAALFSTLVLFVLTQGFTFYVDNFASYSSTYGSLGGVIVLLLWLYLSSIVFILGGYFAASIMEYRRREIE